MVFTMDNLTKEQRHKAMSAVKSKDTSIELILRKALWKRGIRYRKNYNVLPGKPDIAITKYKIAVFCDSEFWHGFDWEHRKLDFKSNRKYWIEKIEKNMERDLQVDKNLRSMGWKVIRFWGRDIQKNLEYCCSVIEDEILLVKISTTEIDIDAD